mmetsp:Transcript_88335/g.279518  ORF Transcript_88335/g.279518 Transcript_88335/m.279518 type:complete len:316 (+) Transcript_88335:337-1284(+)
MNSCVCAASGAPPETMARRFSRPSPVLILLSTWGVIPAARASRQSTEQPSPLCWPCTLATAALATTPWNPPVLASFAISPVLMSSRMAGTATSSVGLATSKSHPSVLSLAMYGEEGVSVRAWAYAMLAPLTMQQVSTMSSRMCARGRKARKRSVSMGLTTPWAKMEAMRAQKFLCVSMTPFGTPVDPEVYMMKARSSVLGANLAVSMGFALPAVMRSSNVVTSAKPTGPKLAACLGRGKALVEPPTVSSGTKHLPMRMMWRRDLIFASTVSFRDSNCPQSRNSTVASVSTSPCNMASCPRVVYTVVMGMPSWYIA